MKLLIDLNVVFDILMDRAPFADAAENVCSDRSNVCCVSAHTLTTVAYVMRKYDTALRVAAIDFLLNNFTIVPCDRGIFVSARQLGFADFEDAVIASTAKKAKCKYIITRNKRDFARSPIPALTPGEFLAL